MFKDKIFPDMTLYAWIMTFDSWTTQNRKIDLNRLDLNLKKYEIYGDLIRAFLCAILRRQMFCNNLLHSTIFTYNSQGEKIKLDYGSVKVITNYLQNDDLVAFDAAYTGTNDDDDDDII